MEEKPNRKRLRLINYDYNSDGYYFVTICTKDRKCVLGQINSVGSADSCAPQMKLSNYGEITFKGINAIIEYVDKYIIMPNHIHMILRFNNSKGGVSGTPRPTNRLSGIIGYYKRLVNNQIGFNIWQTSFYDHIIRNEQDYLRIWEYIDTNVIKWATDEYFT